MFSLICVWINDWVNNRETGDLRRYCAHYGVTVMYPEYCQASNISGILIGNKIVDHSDAVGESPLSAAPTTSSCKDNCKTRRGTFKFWYLLRLVLEVWRHIMDYSVSTLILFGCQCDAFLGEWDWSRGCIVTCSCAVSQNDSQMATIKFIRVITTVKLYGCSKLYDDSYSNIDLFTENIKKSIRNLVNTILVLDRDRGGLTLVENLYSSPEIPVSGRIWGLRCPGQVSRVWISNYISHNVECNYYTMS